ncbi:hypothetical protein F2Q68_00003027 [Brassica cretica]|uniref:AtPDCT1/2 transmembrane domain-containing protein n=1 Tax=Brassica cretica TaxID=69181 RepID=A0A8S9JFZ5_BRACR|nr:hypothetical protein F2Q68_00003027 [Brassica cretica]
MSTNTVVPLRRRSNGYHTNGVAFNGMENIVKKTDDCYTNGNGVGGKSKASFLTWTMRDAVYDFLGSGVDFPVGNVSFFLFYSGHVAGSMIASLDMRRMQRLRLAMLFDILNILQSIRLLGTRGHYTIDLAVGVGAGILFDSLAGKYEEMMSKRHNLANGFSLISKDSLVN